MTDPARNAESAALTLTFTVKEAEWIRGALDGHQGYGAKRPAPVVSADAKLAAALAAVQHNDGGAV